MTAGDVSDKTLLVTAEVSKGEFALSTDPPKALLEPCWKSTAVTRATNVD
jgi:hypothetical protein